LRFVAGTPDCAPVRKFLPVKRVESMNPTGTTTGWRLKEPETR
jgi:hypothetical protein